MVKQALRSIRYNYYILRLAAVIIQQILSVTISLQVKNPHLQLYPACLRAKSRPERRR